MMLNAIKGLIAGLLLWGIPLQASATLISVTDTLVFDDLTSQYWYSNISEFSGGTGGVDKALQWIPGNYFGLTTWHLASKAESNNLLSGTTMADFLNYFPHTGTYSGGAPWDLGTGPTGNYKYWVGGTDSYFLLPSTSWPLATDLFTVRINYDSSDLGQLNPLSIEYDLGGDGAQWLRLREVGAWVTAFGSAPGSQAAAPVPEPATLLLLVSAMVGLACNRYVSKRVATRRE